MHFVKGNWHRNNITLQISLLLPHFRPLCFLIFSRLNKKLNRMIQQFLNGEINFQIITATAVDDDEIESCGWKEFFRICKCINLLMNKITNSREREKCEYICIIKKIYVCMMNGNMNRMSSKANSFLLLNGNEKLERVVEWDGGVYSDGAKRYEFSFIIPFYISVDIVITNWLQYIERYFFPPRFFGIEEGELLENALNWQFFCHE